jgi:predicted peptidase
MAQKSCLLAKKMTKQIHCCYLLFLPSGYERTKKKWPLILFLHGAGERGDDLNLVKKHGVAKIVENDPAFPFIVASPQCPKEQWWSMEALVALLDNLETKYRIDPERIYVTGLSMGGFATWQLAFENPHRFAAIAPICGGGIANLTFRVKHLPIWAFHGAKDETVPVEESQRLVAALRKRGGKPKLTIYRNAGHDSWTLAYANKKLYAWFLAHRKQSIKI